MLAVSLWFDESSEMAITQVHLGLSISQLVLCILVGTSFLAIPRRPDVFLTNKKPCEKQRTVSALSGLFFAWPVYLTDLAAAKTLGLEDLPGMDLLTRSKDSHAAFPKTGRKIWRRIFWAHWSQFLTQWTLVLISTAFSFAPRFELLNLLRVLEKRRDISVYNDKEAWIWVLVLGLSNVIAIVIDSQLQW